MHFLYKITFLLIILVVLSSLTQFVVFDRLFLSNTDSLLLDINELAANNLSIELSENFRKIENSLKVIAADKKFRESQELLDKVNLVIPEVDVITILNQQGDILLVSGNTKNPIVSNLSQREYFQQAIQGKTYISDVYTTSRGAKAVSIAVPIIKNEHIDGVVVGTVKLHETSLASMFDNKFFGKNGYIAILDRQGDIVYHPNKERIGQKATIFEQLDEKEGSKIVKDFSGSDHFVGYSKVNDLDWIVSVNTPTADIIKSRNIMIYEIWLLSIIAVIAIVLIGAFTVRRYAKPLDELVQAFNSLKNGKYKKINFRHYEKEFHEMIQIYNKAVEKLEEVHSNLEEAADTDPLTGAYNRRAFENLFYGLDIEINNRSLDSLGVLLIDIDNFKGLNDTRGHLAGDDILKKVTEIMMTVAGTQSVFRFGGDEFAVVLRNISYKKLFSIAESIRSESEKSLNGCTLSIGIAKIPEDTNSIEQIVSLADKALYISKESKNKVTSI